VVELTPVNAHLMLVVWMFGFVFKVYFNPYPSNFRMIPLKLAAGSGLRREKG